MREHEREIRRELRQRARALATGELVRPLRSIFELEATEQANQAEINLLQSRRSKLWSALSAPGLGTHERSDYADSAESAAHALDLAYAVKRRLRVARSLMVRTA